MNVTTNVLPACVVHAAGTHVGCLPAASAGLTEQAHTELAALLSPHPTAVEMELRGTLQLRMHSIDNLFTPLHAPRDVAAVRHATVSLFAVILQPEAILSTTLATYSRLPTHGALLQC